MRADLLPDSGRLAGIVTAGELRTAGVGQATLRSLVGRDEMLPLGRGVYARGELAAALLRDEPRGERMLRLAAAIAVFGDGAVGSHHDAAVVHGLALLDRPPADLVAVSRAPGLAGTRTGRAGVRLHIARLPSRHVTAAAGLPVTTVARTVIDLARTMPFRSGVVVADSALRDQKTSASEFQAVIDDCARWPGISKARQVAAFSHPFAESPFESIARVAFRDGGLPPPVLQAWISGGQGRMISRVDFLWAEHGTIAETDGAMKYADPDRARQQLRRDAELRQAGFEVVHITWAELLSDPDRVVRSIRAAFGRHAALRSRAG